MKETQHIEYKESWRDEHLKWICGFANAEGGISFAGKYNTDKVKWLPIATTFFRAGKTEVWEREIERILDIGFRDTGIQRDWGKITQKTTQKSTQKTAQKILAVLAVNPFFSRREIAKVWVIFQRMA